MKIHNRCHANAKVSKSLGIIANGRAHAFVGSVRVQNSGYVVPAKTPIISKFFSVLYEMK